MTATMDSLPNEIAELALTARRWKLRDGAPMMLVCRRFHGILATTRKLRVVVPCYRTLSIPLGKRILALNPNIFVDVDCNDGRTPFSPAPLWIWSLAIPGTVYNSDMWHGDYEPALTCTDAKAINKFLSQNPKNRISMKHYEYELSDATMVLDHGDSPSDYDDVESAFKRLGVIPRVLVYRKSGPFDFLPKMKGQVFTTKHTFPTIEKLVLEDFTFDEFMRIKDHGRFPRVPKAVEFLCKRRLGEIGDFWHEDHEEQIRDNVLPILKATRSYKVNSTWGIKAES